MIMQCSDLSVQKNRTICIATVTRNRPCMLKNLLASYAAMRAPENIELHFIVVENNSEPNLQDIINDFRRQVAGSTVQYEIEPNLGIAFARNHALEYALGIGADLLTFADDDEVVQPDWLVELLGERDAFNLDIVGSPVRFATVPYASVWERMIWAGLSKGIEKTERKAFRRRKTGQAGRILIATGSWMGSLEFFRRTGLRFDNALGLNGGEDWRLYRHARKIGAQTGWAPHAIAYETIPRDRLSLRYHFRRSKDGSAVDIRFKLANRRIVTLARLPGSLAGRLIKLSGHLIAIPFTHGASLVPAASCMGNIVGIFQAFTAKTSCHYQKTSGL